MVRLGKDPLRTWAAPSLEGRHRLSDATPGGKALGEDQAVLEGHRGAFGLQEGDAASQQHRPRGHLRRALGDEAPGDLPHWPDRVGADGELANRGVDTVGAVQGEAGADIAPQGG